MRALLDAGVSVVIVAVLSSAMAAQWPAHPTPGVPRLPNGEPNLDAPAPRTADGKPDLSGLWRAGGGLGKPAPADVSSPVPVAGFRNVAAAIKEGLPLTPWGAEVLKTRQAGNSKDNPEAHCLPMGIMQFHTQGAPRKFIQTPSRAGHPVRGQLGHAADLHRRPGAADQRPAAVVVRLLGRQMGRRHAGRGDEQFARRWLARHHREPADRCGEGDRAIPATSAYGRMEIDITVDDPKAYTKPWTVRVNQQIMLDTDLIEFICAENNRFGVQ